MSGVGAQDYDNVPLRACTQSELSQIDGIVQQLFTDIRNTDADADSLVTLFEKWVGYQQDLPDCYAAYQIQYLYTHALEYLIARTALADAGPSELAQRYASGIMPALSEEFWEAACHLEPRCTNENGDSNATNSSSGTATSGETFEVVVNGNVNLRSCAGTQCSTVGTAQNGSLLTVLDTEEASDGVWYQVETDNGSTAYIAGWLTTRGPDQIIATDEAYTDLATLCIVAFDIKRGDQSMSIILAGDGRSGVVVDLFKPNQTQPVRVNAQYDKTFIDTGDPYIHQTYGWGEYWPTGVYQLEISRNGETSRLAWELEQQGDYNIFVYCQ